jgi:hypothetical protein
MAEAGILLLSIEYALQLEDLVERMVRGTEDFRQYGSSAEKLRLQLQIEANRMRDIKCLLFGTVESNHSGGIFGRFDRKTQLDILNVLRHFQELLKLNLQPIDDKYSFAEPTATMIIDTAFPLSNFQHSTLSTRLLWGFRGKKKLEETVKELQSWNDRLFSMVQLHYIRIDQTPSPKETRGPAENRRKIPLLQDSKEAEISGYLHLSNDKKILDLATSPSTLSLANLDLGNPVVKMHSDQASDTLRCIATMSNKDVLLDYKTYTPNDDGEPFSSTVSRIAHLANILHEAKSDRFRTLYCLGYLLDKRNNRFLFVFDIPQGVSLSYESLKSSFHTSHAPALEDRIALAKALSMSLSQLFTVGWVHKSFRSDNILFFNPKKSSDALVNERPEKHWSVPYVLGFEYARPESEFSSKLIDRDQIGENVYRHPDQWGFPSNKFSATHDIYSLGVVLLEIALWKPAISLSRTRFQGYELGSLVYDCLRECAAHHKVRAAVGRKYQDIILRCLAGEIRNGSNAGGSTDSVTLLETFNSDVVDVLDDILQCL